MTISSSPVNFVDDLRLQVVDWPQFFISREVSERGKTMSKLGAVLFLFSALSWSQSFTGSIRGTITDNTKAPVPAAKVTVTDADRNVDYSTVTDSSGRYILPT